MKLRGLFLLLVTFVSGAHAGPCFELEARQEPARREAISDDPVSWTTTYYGLRRVAQSHTLPQGEALRELRDLQALLSPGDPEAGEMLRGVEDLMTSRDQHHLVRVARMSFTDGSRLARNLNASLHRDELEFKKLFSRQEVEWDRSIESRRGWEMLGASVGGIAGALLEPSWVTAAAGALFGTVATEIFQARKHTSQLAQYRNLNLLWQLSSGSEGIGHLRFSVLLWQPALKGLFSKPLPQAMREQYWLGHPKYFEGLEHAILNGRGVEGRAFVDEANRRAEQYMMGAFVDSIVRQEGDHFVWTLIFQHKDFGASPRPPNQGNRRKKRIILEAGRGTQGALQPIPLPVSGR